MELMPISEIQIELVTNSLSCTAVEYYRPLAIGQKSLIFNTRTLSGSEETAGKLCERRINERR